MKQLIISIADNITPTFIKLEVELSNGTRREQCFPLDFKRDISNNEEYKTVVHINEIHVVITE